MNWTLTAQILAIVVAYVGGILAIGRFMTHSLGKRIDHLNNRIDDLASKTASDNLAIIRLIQGLDKRMDDMNTTINARFSDMNNRFDDLRNQMQREHDNLARKVDTLTDTVTAHISDQTIHQPPRV